MADIPPCNPNYKDAAWAFYRFEPITGVAVVFAVLFAITTALHAFQMIRTKTWYLSPFVIGGVCETIGYAARAVSASEKPGCWTLTPYIVQNVLILIAPALMAASIYMILGRIILLTDGESHALIRRRWLTKIFVTGDVVALLMQSSGGGLMAMGRTDPGMKDVGERMIIAGLFVQLAVFGFFIAVAGVFHRRMALASTPRAADPTVRWRWYLATLYVTSALIWFRSLFRAIEYIDGNDGVLMRSEVYVFVFDSALMFAVMVWMNWFHPSEIGLLLRGEKAFTNGFELTRMGGRGGKSYQSGSDSSMFEILEERDRAEVRKV